MVGATHIWLEFLWRPKKDGGVILIDLDFSWASSTNYLCQITNMESKAPSNLLTKFFLVTVVTRVHLIAIKSRCYKSQKSLNGTNLLDEFNVIDFVVGAVKTWSNCLLGGKQIFWKCGSKFQIDWLFWMSGRDFVIHRQLQ